MTPLDRSASDAFVLESMQQGDTPIINAGKEPLAIYYGATLLCVLEPGDRLDLKPKPKDGKWEWQRTPAAQRMKGDGDAAEGFE